MQLLKRRIICKEQIQIENDKELRVDIIDGLRVSLRVTLKRNNKYHDDIVINLTRNETIKLCNVFKKILRGYISND